MTNCLRYDTISITKLKSPIFIRKEGYGIMIKSFKIRIYPTKAQEQLLWKHIGCCRYIYNWLLNKQQENRKAGGEYLSQF